jgi:hypothetical protein
VDQQGSENDSGPQQHAFQPVPNACEEHGDTEINPNAQANRKGPYFSLIGHASECRFLYDLLTRVGALRIPME